MSSLVSLVSFRRATLLSMPTVTIVNATASGNQYQNYHLSKARFLEENLRPRFTSEFTTSSATYKPIPLLRPAPYLRDPSDTRNADRSNLSASASRARHWLVSWVEETKNAQYKVFVAEEYFCRIGQCQGGWPWVLQISQYSLVGLYSLIVREGMI